MKMTWKLGLALSVMAASTGLAANITVWDNSNNPGSGNSWYNGTNEDQEVEPGMARSQEWDMEAFVLNGNILTVVAGFNFVAGVNDGDSRANWDADGIWQAGDLFVAIGSPAPLYGGHAGDGVSGDGVASSTVLNDWDYVFDIDWEGSQGVSLIDLAGQGSDPAATVWTPYFQQNSGSHAFRYEAGGTTVLSGLSTSQYTPDLGLLDLASLQGGTHFAFNINIQPILDLASASEDIYFTMTMECGNDNLVGMTVKGASVADGGMTMLLLGVALLGIESLRRRRG